MLFCCLWCNIETSCHKHFVVVVSTLPPSTNSAALTTSGKCHNLPRSGGAVLITHGSRSVVKKACTSVFTDSTRMNVGLVSVGEDCQISSKSDHLVGKYDVISIFQDGRGRGRGHSVLLPVSYLLMFLLSEGQSLLENQI